MDTGNIMQNQMDALIEQGIQLQKEICDQAEFIYKNHKLSPAELLKQRDELLEAVQYAKSCLINLSSEMGQIGDSGDQALQALEDAIQKTTP